MKKIALISSLLITVNAYTQNCPVQILSSDTTVYTVCADGTVDLTSLIDTRGLTVQWDILTPGAASIGKYKLTVDSSGCKDTVFITVSQKIKTWLGTEDDNWHNPLNWTGNSLPDDSTHIIINRGTPFPCVVRDIDAGVASLQVNQGADFTVAVNRNLDIKANCSSMPSVMELAPNTVVMDSATAQLIQFLDSSTLVFSGTTAQLDSLATGDIIISNIATVAAPFGLLRKITAIQTAGNLTSFTTSEAALTETFKELHLDARKFYAEGDTLQRVTAINPFTIPMPDLILYDEDGNNTTTSDQIRIEGDLKIVPNFRFHLDISRFRLHEADIQGGFENTLTNSIVVGSAVGDNILAERTLLTKPLNPIVIGLLVIVPTLEVKIGVTASVNVEASASNINTNSALAYIRYQNNSWSAGAERSMQNQFNFTGITGTAEAKLYLVPSISFKLYGSNWAKGSVELEAYLEMIGELFPTPGCELTAGLSVGAEANLGFFDNEYPIASYPNILHYSQLLFTCPQVQLPTVSTAAVTNVGSSSAMSGGNVTNDGGGTVSARGVCWSTTANPTIANSRTINGSGTGSFSSSLNGLSAGTFYYVRAYATNNAGTSYGNSVTFTTQSASTLPTVSTSSVSNVTGASATCGGNVSSDGGATVTARGVCWSTSFNPTTSNNKTIDGSGTGSFISSISGLSPNTLYYIRAYATNSNGTAYDVSSSFLTPATTSLPTVTTASITNITSSTSSGGGNVTSDGGAAVTTRGVCWSTSPNPTIANSKTINGSGTGSFTSSITGLAANTTYYVRAYATNSVGTAYGNGVSFTTTAAPISITPADLCTASQSMQVNTVYQVNVNVASYGLGAPISGQSTGGGNVRGFWLAVSVPVGYYATSIQIYDVSSNFNPVVGLKSNCSFAYYPNTNTGADFANAAGNGGNENFGTGLTGPEPNNDGLYYIRIYHYNGSETPTISFKIKVL